MKRQDPLDGLLRIASGIGANLDRTRTQANVAALIRERADQTSDPELAAKLRAKAMEYDQNDGSGA